MRIGILTLPLHTNYGGILQAYALQTVLERMGHEVVVFNKPYYHPWYDEIQVRQSFPRRIINKLRRIKGLMFHQKDSNIKLKQFIKRYIHQLEVDDWYALKESRFDAIVVGSDQIFRAKEIRKQISWEDVTIPFLSFTKGWRIKRLSYAASFGTDDWEYSEEQTKECGDLLREFNAVSVREKSGIQLCKEKFGVSASWVLDPTFLLEKQSYTKLFHSNNVSKSPGNLLCYILDTNHTIEAQVVKFSKIKHLEPFYCNQEDSDGYKYSIEAWLRGFFDAEYVITDSFHACVFSIIFNKPFIALGNATRGQSRFLSLLDMFDLKDRLVSANNPERIITTLENAINWEEVNQNLEKYKHESFNWLRDNLK